MTLTDRDWIETVLQHCLVGCHSRVRLQDFSDIRARIDWLSRSEPWIVRVERFVLDPKLPKGRVSQVRLRNLEFLRNKIPKGTPSSWLPVLQGSAFMDEIRKHSSYREWVQLIKVPIIFGPRLLGSLSIEVRLDALMRKASKPNVWLGAKDFFSEVTGGDDNPLEDPFDSLHPVAAICGYIELWARGTRNIRNAVEIGEVLLSNSVLVFIFHPALVS